MFVFLFTKISGLLPIRLRYYYFYLFNKFQFKKFLLNMKSFREIITRNYQRYLMRKTGSDVIPKGFYTRFIKTRNAQASDFLTLMSATDKEMDKKIHINYQGKDLFNKYMEEKKGVIIAIPHISSYTSIFLILAKFLKLKTNIMALSYETSSLFESDMLEGWTSNFLDRVHIISVSNFSLVNAYDSLKKGELLIILPELPTTSFSDKESYPKFMFDMENIPQYPLSDFKVSFLNDTIYATQGIVQLSMKTGAPVLFTVMRKSGALDYNLSFNEINFSNEKEDLQENIQVLYQELEKEIVLKPYEWTMWSHVHKLICNSIIKDNDALLQD